MNHPNLGKPSTTLSVQHVGFQKSGKSDHSSRHLADRTLPYSCHLKNRQITASGFTTGYIICKGSLLGDGIILL